MLKPLFFSFGAAHQKYEVALMHTGLLAYRVLSMHNLFWREVALGETYNYNIVSLRMSRPLDSNFSIPTPRQSK